MINFNHASIQRKKFHPHLTDKLKFVFYHFIFLHLSLDAIGKWQRNSNKRNEIISTDKFLHIGVLGDEFTFISCAYEMNALNK